MMPQAEATLHLLLLGLMARADEPADALRLRFTLAELPDLASPRPTWPTMDASLGLAAGADQLVVYGVHGFYEAVLPDKPSLQKGLGLASVGALSGGLFLVHGWVHEEWHRAVLSRADVGSRNGLYHPEAWSNGLISVDHVSDEDLARFKDAHPADYVRMSSAGMEAQYALSQRINDSVFFGDQTGERWGKLFLADSWMAPVLVANELSVTLYDLQCADQANDELTAAENELRTDVPSRDFTGLDCTAWVYDMRRPDEAYAARGEHPSGVGVDRYRSWSDLSADEQGYLEDQVLLGLLNYVNPQLLGFTGLQLGEGLWTARLGQVAAPWGHRVDTIVGFRGPNLKGTVALQSGFAGNGWYPGLALGLVDHPLPAGLSLDAEADLWLQPADQRWDAAGRAPGGRLRADLNLPLTPGFAISPGVDAKSRGFVVGLPTVEPAVLGRLGIVATLR